MFVSLVFPLTCTAQTGANWINLHKESNGKKNVLTDTDL